MLNNTQLRKTFLRSLPNGPTTSVVSALVFVPGAGVGDFTIDPRHTFMPEEDGYVAYCHINMTERRIIRVVGLYGPDLPTIAYFGFPPL